MRAVLAVPGFAFELYKLTHNAEPVVRLLVLPPVEGRWPISREALYVTWKTHTEKQFQDDVKVLG